MDADEMDVDLDAADEMDVDLDSPSSSASTPASGSVSGVLSELAAIHRRASSSSATSPPLSLPSLTYLSSSPSAAASLIPRLATASIPASSLLGPLTASLTAHPLPAVAAANPNSGSAGGNPRKRKNQRQRQPAAASGAPPSLLPRAISLLADAAGRLPLGSHPDARRSLVDTAAELAAFDVLAAVLGSDYHAVAMQDVIRSLAPVVLSATKSTARLAAVQFLVTKLVPLGAEEEEEGVRNAVAYLPRYLAVKAPDKTEARGLAVEAIVEVVQALGEEDREGFAGYVVAMAKGKAKGRLLAVDLVLAMLPMLLPSNEDDTGMVEDSWGLKFLHLLIERCSDIVGGVRARALMNAAQALDILSLRGVQVARLQEVMKIDNMGIGELLRRRCTDDKAAVRKAALVLTTKAIGLIGRPVDESLLCAIGTACSDPLVSIRKAALAAISEVFRRFPDEKVTKEWLQAVPPLVIDSETSIQDEWETNSALWAVNRVSLLQTISNVSMELPVEPAAELADSLLSRIQNFDMNLSEVDAHVKSLRTLCKRKAKTTKEGDALTLKWAQQLLHRAFNILEQYMKEASEAGSHSFATPLRGKCTGMKEASIPKSTSQAVVAVFTVGSLILACPNASVKNITPLLHTIITSGNSVPRPEKLRDYVKWRGVLFLRFLPSLVDESEKIRHLADYLFGNILKGHGAYSNSQGRQDRGPALFTIRGADERSRSKRMHVYVSLLKQMAPEHLLATSAKLCAEVLAAACDGSLSVDDAAGRAVLQDALQILACKEMRIHPNICTDNSEMDEEGSEGGATASALQVVKGRLVTQVAKKNLIQVAVPIFNELKRVLQSKNSPLLGCLWECLRALLKDYKNEIEEILVVDKQLQKELLYDMQKYEAGKGKAKARAEAGPSGTGRSPAGQTPSRQATARLVMKEVNANTPTPTFHSKSRIPKVPSILGLPAVDPATPTFWSRSGGFSRPLSPLMRISLFTSVQVHYG
ncbi:hypothetical protein PR202_gb23534 [Eleusine coracana subsp. coracana]|uniref:Condensin complex subunit 1 C-terminal domain-containing protein n=1 Tax=Eleusine coracana subsp. coracana TaxID=191504 RepID=A0AAV5FJ24_ELECO|nr:hypothetical protein PR202_gb23534 [Eleusine coracana subsp. coracana]